MKIVFVADTHTGSKVALVNPKRTTPGSKGREVQKALYDIWGNSTKGKWRKPDALIHCAEAIEGKDTKDGGVGVWTPDIMEQVEAAEEVIKMWNPKRYFIIRGSQYHVSLKDSGYQAEEQLARNLKAEIYPNQEKVEGEKDRSGWHWYLTFGGVTFHVAHKIGLSRVFHYRSTPIARQMLNAKLNDGLRHIMSKYSTRIVIRAHAHYYWYCESSHSAGMNLPCWKALDSFMQMSGATDISPDIGFVGFECEEGEYRYERKLWRLEDAQAPPHTIIGGGKCIARNPEDTAIGTIVK